MDEFDVTIVEAGLSSSQVSGQPVLRLEFLPRGLCFCDDRLVSKLFSYMSNVHPLAGSKRAWLRRALGLVASPEPFTGEELRSIVGRRLRVGVETVEFRDILRLRVTDFLRYSGAVMDLTYSDNEYVFMIRELLQEGGRR